MVKKFLLLNHPWNTICSTETWLNISMQDSYQSIKGTSLKIVKTFLSTTYM
jgi:hypothetical protein